MTAAVWVGAAAVALAGVAAVLIPPKEDVVADSVSLLEPRAGARTRRRRARAASRTRRRERSARTVLRMIKAAPERRAKIAAAEAARALPWGPGGLGVCAHAPRDVLSNRSPCAARGIAVRMDELLH